METETLPTCLNSGKRDKGKVPKRVNKAEREKKKREHLNDLFLSLADALGVDEQNNGKASILCETTRAVKDMLDQIESLKREKATLLSESQYVTLEKNELQDENSVLQVEVEKLKRMLRERTVQPNLDLNLAPPEPLELPVNDPTLQAPMLNQIFIIPARSNLQVHETDAAMLADKPISNVSKPHPRYPTPSDSWPLQLLEKHL